MSVPQVTPVFDTCWKFAAERNRIYEKRLRGESPPWTNDRIILKNRHRFRRDRAAEFHSSNLVRPIRAV